MDKNDQYYDLVSDIVVMCKFDRIPEAIKLSSELERFFFDDIKPYIKAFDLQHADVITTVTTKELHENMKYIVYNRETNERKCIVTDIRKQTIQDEFSGESFEINVFSGYDLENGKKVDVSEIETLNCRNRFEENLPSLIDMLMDFGERTNSQDKTNFLVNNLKEQISEQTFIINLPKSRGIKK
jgi:hypothetical protein